MVAAGQIHSLTDTEKNIYPYAQSTEVPESTGILPRYLAIRNQDDERHKSDPAHKNLDNSSVTIIFNNENPVTSEEAHEQGRYDPEQDTTDNENG